MTLLEKLQKKVRDAGYTNSAADWENEFNAYAFSVEDGNAYTFGHPCFTAHYSKNLGWLELTGPKGCEATKIEMESI